MKSAIFSFIKSDKKLIKLFFDDIAVIKGLGNYVEIYTTSNKKFVYYKTLKELIETLPDEFMRVHNSHIVNLTNIDYFENNQIVLKHMKVTVAKSYKDCVVNAINSMML